MALARSPPGSAPIAPARSQATLRQALYSRRAHSKRLSTSLAWVGVARSGMVATKVGAPFGRFRYRPTTPSIWYATQFTNGIIPPRYDSPWFAQASDGSRPKPGIALGSRQAPSTPATRGPRRKSRTSSAQRQGVDQTSAPAKRRTGEAWG